MAFTVYQLKPAFQQLLRPTVGLLFRAGITANQVTVWEGYTPEELPAKVKEELKVKDMKVALSSN